MENMLPPQDFEAEQCVIGSLLLYNEAVFEVIDLIDETCFYGEVHKSIFLAIKSLSEKNEPIDIVTLSNELKKQNKLEIIGGDTYLAELYNSVPTATNALYYAKIVKEKYQERNLLNTCREIVNDIYNSGLDTEELLNSAESKVFQVTSDKVKLPYLHVKEAIKNTFDKLEEIYKSGLAHSGVNTGYLDLDKLLGGFKPGQFIVIAARPGVGKTALAMNFARNAALRVGKTVVVFSLEMTKEEVTGRLLCSEARVDVSKLNSNELKDEDWGRLSRAAAEISETDIFIDDKSGITPGEIRAKCRRIQSMLNSQKKNLDMVIIDYLQLMRMGSGINKNANREQIVSEISRTLKEIAKELSVPVIALSQLNRESEKRQDKRPMISDLRESGSIEQDADCIMFIYRDEMYNEDSDHKGIAEIIVAKNRSGPRGVIQLSWLPRFTAFENLAKNY